MPKEEIKDYLIDGKLYSDSEYCEGDEFHPLDEKLAEDDEGGPGSVYISIKWTPKTGVYTPDGKKLRGRYRVKNIRKVNGAYIVILLNGAGIKLNPSIPLNKQGFKFKIQYAKPLTIEQAYKYLNPDVREDNALMTNEVYAESVSSENKVKNIEISESGYFKITLESNGLILLDPDRELVNETYAFFLRNGEKVNMLEATIEYFNIPIIESLYGYEIEEQFLTENINEANPIKWVSDALKKGTEWFKQRQIRRASKLGAKEADALARVIWTGWARVAGGAGLEATPENLMKFLQREKFSNEIINAVSKAATKKFDKKFPEPESSPAKGTLSSEVAKEIPDTAKASEASPNYRDIFKQVHQTWTSFSDKFKASKDNKEGRQQVKKELEDFLKGYAANKAKYMTDVNSGKSAEDPNVDNFIKHLDSQIAKLSRYEELSDILKPESETISKEVTESVLEADEDEDKEEILDKDEIRNFFLLIAQVAIANNYSVPKKYIKKAIETKPELWGNQETSPAPTVAPATQPLPSYTDIGGYSDIPYREPGSTRRSQSRTRSGSSPDEVFENAAHLGRVHPKDALRTAARISDPKAMGTKDGATQAELIELAKLGWGLARYILRVGIE